MGEKLQNVAAFFFAFLRFYVRKKKRFFLRNLKKTFIFACVFLNLKQIII